MICDAMEFQKGKIKMMRINKIIKKKNDNQVNI